jgi:hypothetical protein
MMETRNAVSQRVNCLSLCILMDSSDQTEFNCAGRTNIRMSFGLGDDGFGDAFVS